MGRNARIVMIAAAATLLVGAVALYGEDLSVQGSGAKDQSRLVFDPTLPTDFTAPHADHVVTYSKDDAVWWGGEVAKKGDRLDTGAIRGKTVESPANTAERTVATLP